MVLVPMWLLYSSISLSLGFLLSGMRIILVIHTELLYGVNEMACVNTSPRAWAPSKRSNVSYYTLRLCLTLGDKCYLHLTITSVCVSCITLSNSMCIKYRNECTDTSLAKLTRCFHVICSECSFRTRHHSRDIPTY